MVPVAFPQQNLVLTATPGVPRDKCGSLDAYRGPLPDGTPAVVTCYEPTAAEWVELWRTGRVWLLVMGDRTPPTALTAFDPFAAVPKPAGGD